MKYSHLKINQLIFRIITGIFTILIIMYAGRFVDENDADAATDNVNWMRVNTPRQGDIGNWILAEGSDITNLTITDDNVLYCYADPDGTSQRLFKSTDGGKKWYYTGSVTQSINDIAVPESKNSIIYYATESSIYKSTDGGETFIQLPVLPGSPGIGNVIIQCIDVTSSGVGNIIAVGTVDKDNAEYGEVYLYDESETVPLWIDTGLDNYDICELVFSPSYLSDGILTAVITDEIDTCIVAKIGTGAWYQDIKEVKIPGICPISGMIIFPEDYADSTGKYSLYTALDSGNGSGDIYLVDFAILPGLSMVTDLNIGMAYGLAGVDITGLAGTALSGNYCLFAGAANCTQVYYSKDYGQSWERCIKQPTGQRHTLVVVDNNGSIFSATEGIESAISCSLDGGLTYNQQAMIDTEISSSCMIDLAVSPNYSNDGVMFLLTVDTVNTEFSLWRSVNKGINWERIFSSSLDNIDSISGVSVSPQYGNSNRTVYIKGIASGIPAIWKSTDNGQVFTKRTPPLSVDVWKIVNDDKLFIGCFDGTDAIVYFTEDGGLTFSAGAVAGKQILTSLEISPGDSGENLLLVGNRVGGIYYSENNGQSFKPVPLDAESPPFNGLVTVTFDTDFENKKLIYAGSGKADEGIYRFIFNQSDEWERIDAGLPAGGTICGLVISDSGVLYALNTNAVNSVKKKGGMERSLNPSFQLSPTFETVNRGLDDGVILQGLWTVDNRLWSLDTTNTRLMTFLDTMAQPVVLQSPAHYTAGLDTTHIVINWEALDGATEYEWQVDYDNAFSSISTDLNDYTESTSKRLPSLETDTSYHWRVRATRPVLSLWSEKRSFTTVLQSETGLVLLSPGAGAELISTEPLFQWSAIAGAEKYELLVSGDITFKNPVIKKTDRAALPATAWQSNVSLDNDKTYYWKVRAIGSDSYSDWSAVSAFLTEPGQQKENPENAVNILSSEKPILLSPGAGSEGVSQRPLFQWEIIDGADSYELMVSTETSFDNPVINRDGEYALPVTAWRSNISLDYDTAYYWKVRALIDGGVGDWSPVSVFTIESTPVDDSERKEQIDQQTQPVIIQTPASTLSDIPDFIIYLGLGLLIANVILQTAVLLVVLLTRNKAG